MSVLTVLKTLFKKKKKNLLKIHLFNIYFWLSWEIFYLISITSLFCFYNEDCEAFSTMMAMGKVLWEGWTHLFIPYTSAEYMSYAYVPGTTLGSEATENKTQSLDSGTSQTK